MTISNQMTDAPDGTKSWVNLNDLVTWKGNYNEGDVGGIYTSIVQFGYNRTISVWQDNIVMAGNHTMLALKMAKNAGMTPVLPTDDVVLSDKQFLTHNITVDAIGDWYVLVSDCSHLTHLQAIAYAIADNEWSSRAVRDESMLLTHLQAVADDAEQSGNDDMILATGYDNDELELLTVLVADDAQTLDELSEQYGESDADPDDLTNSMTTSPIIRVQVDRETWVRWHDLIDGASETEHGKRLAEILNAVVDSDLSWNRE